MATLHEKMIKAICADRGIQICQHGLGFRIIGPGIDVLAANFNSLQIADLQPAKFKFGSGGYVLIR